MEVTKKVLKTHTSADSYKCLRTVALSYWLAFLAAFMHLKC